MSIFDHYDEIKSAAEQRGIKLTRDQTALLVLASVVRQGLNDFTQYLSTRSL